MPHLNEENRNTFSSMLARNVRCIEIAKIIGCDPTNVSKEIMKNRIISNEGIGNKKFLCKKLEKCP